jgi:hypothetical protein
MQKIFLLKCLILLAFIGFNKKKDKKELKKIWQGRNYAYLCTPQMKKADVL